jgi:biotin carboxylase
MRTLFVNRHALDWATGVRGDYIPAPEQERHLVTRVFGDGLRGYDPSGFATTAVLDTRGPARLEALTRWLVREHAVERLVTLHEKDVLPAAQLREELGLPGMGVAQALRFRDKALMKDVLREAGYTRVPRFRSLEPGEEVRSVEWSGPSVVKSRWGVGSSQVRIVESLDAANRAIREMSEGDSLEIEEYVEGTMYHCDSVVHEGRVLFTAVSEYLSPPANFRRIRYNGSLLLTGGPVRQALIQETQDVIHGLGLRSGVTHIEFFRRSSGEFVFCEAAARPAGGAVDENFRRVYGVNVVRACVELQCGVAPSLPAAVAEPESTLGVIWVYHSGTGRDRPAVHVRELPGVVSYAFAPQAVPGLVRHMTDYAHKITVSARDREEFEAVVDSVLPHVIDREEDRVAPPRSTYLV